MDTLKLRLMFPVMSKRKGPMSMKKRKLRKFCPLNEKCKKSLLKLIEKSSATSMPKSSSVLKRQQGRQIFALGYF